MTDLLDRNADTEIILSFVLMKVQVTHLTYDEQQQTNEKKTLPDVIKPIVFEQAFDWSHIHFFI